MLKNKYKKIYLDNVTMKVNPKKVGHNLGKKYKKRIKDKIYRGDKKKIRSILSSIKTLKTKLKRGKSSIRNLSNVYRRTKKSRYSQYKKYHLI